MTTTDKFDLQKARALADETQTRADAATKGPWHIHEGDLVNIDHKDVFEDWEEAYGPNEDEVGPDTAFILASREDVPALAAMLRAACDEVESERATVAKLREALKLYAYVDRDVYRMMIAENVDIGAKARDVLKETEDAN
jgi:hypothetical protein